MGTHRPAQTVRHRFPDVKVFLSETNIGPGGARNRLIRAAQHEIVASFDDDSYPLERDYFGRVLGLFEQFADASMIAAAIYSHGQELAPADLTAQWVADFTGAGCIYRREAFLATRGYIPLPIAYQLEEVDVAIQLHAMGRKILYTPWLRVFHDTDYSKDRHPTLVAGMIANLAALVYLRYPVRLWLRGLLQVLNLIRHLLQHGRTRGVVAGIAMVPGHLAALHRYRKIVPARTLKSYWSLRRSPLPAASVEFADCVQK